MAVCAYIRDTNIKKSDTQIDRSVYCLSTQSLSDYASWCRVTFPLDTDLESNWVILPTCVNVELGKGS